MADREACERRVYRLATLLTGNPNAAVTVISSVVDAQPDLSRLDNAHMDRLTVLRSREIKPATLVGEGVDHAVASALASLSPQQREVWVFSRVYSMPLREAAKAMDCSVHAAELHLRSASEAMSVRSGGQSESASASLLAYSMSLDVPEFFRQQQQNRIARRRTLALVGLLVLAIVIGLALAWWRDRTLSTRNSPRAPSTDSLGEVDGILEAR